MIQSAPSNFAHQKAKNDYDVIINRYNTEIQRSTEMESKYNMLLIIWYEPLFKQHTELDRKMRNGCQSTHAGC